MDRPGRSPFLRRALRAEAAAVAGIVYSVLAVLALGLVGGLPDGTSATEWRAWIDDGANRGRMLLALASASIAAVAFLWFVAVVRRRVGTREDRFFSTVFLGSALVHVSLWLVAIAVVTAPALAYRSDRGSVSLEAVRLAQGSGNGLLLVAGPRIQAVFVASTSTIFLRTGAVPDWPGYVGYLIAATMFVIPVVTTPTGLGLPAFVFLVSVVILLVAEGRETDAPTDDRRSGIDSPGARPPRTTAP